MKAIETNRKPILLLDFDGVLHSYTSGWQGVEAIPDPPVPGAEAFLRQAVEHFEVMVYSSRSRYANGRNAICAWMVRWFPGDLCGQISIPANKPAAFLTLDDRAICFEGVWPRPAELLKFKPWNKR